MLQFHIAPTTKRQGVIRFGEPQGVPKTHWRLDAQLIFKGRGASVETIRRSKETILHLKKCLDLKHVTLGVNAFRRSSQNVKVDNSITVAYTAKPRCNIQISYEDKWQSTSMHVYVYFLLYTAANFTQTSLQTLVSFQVKKKHVSYTSLFSLFNVQTLTMCLLQFTCINLTWCWHRSHSSQYFHNMDFLATSAKTTSHEQVMEHGLLITSSSLLWSLLCDEGIVRAIPKFPIIVSDITPGFPSTKKCCWVVQICFLDAILTINHFFQS